MVPLAACAAGDQGANSDNPFTTSPPASDTSVVETEALPTEASSAGPGGPGSESESDTQNPTGNSTEPFDPTETPDPGCIEDNDKDGYGEGCALGPDCDDNDFHVFTEEGCANCRDEDMDGFWVGCDQYSELKPGPDCDDDNPEVGASDAVELCDGIAQNCAGEIDPLPADQMCPTDGDGINVAESGGWACNPPAPGEDGCQIVACNPGFYDANGAPNDGCECVGTDRNKSLPACGDEPQGALPVVPEGGVVPPFKGVIPFVGDQYSDWYSVQFPVAMAQGVRPNTGVISVAFAVNPGDPANPDYRLEIYRSCNGGVFEGDLATQFGAGAPPAREWTFFDNHPNPGNANYKNNVPWPEKVYIRVFRVNNDSACSEYTLQVKRDPN